MIIEHTEEFDLAFRFATETNQNIFLTGKAGTGKTTFLKYLRDNSVKNIIVAAPTGVAAINARGVTLHSLFQLPFGIIIPKEPENENEYVFSTHPQLSNIHYNKEKLTLLRSLELLVIDEVSMVTSFIVDAIDTILRYIKKQPLLPFGGVQLLFIGDLYQLPPVIKREDWEILQDYYSSGFFFDSIVLRNNYPVLIELKTIFRQKDNKFIEILNGIRNNDISEENFQLLNSRFNNDYSQDDNEGYITLTTHNYQSDQINKYKLNILETNAYSFTAEISGEFPENNYPSEKELVLKNGAQVMFLKNDNEGKQYYNGKIGIISELDEEVIKVKCKDESWDIEVKKYEWQNVTYKINPETREITEEVIGRFVQYPLRLAWANTIHKSQGLTFDKIIVDAERSFTMGQVYVAISRCTSLEGLILRTPVYRNYFGAHKDIIQWQFRQNETVAPEFEKCRQQFILQEIQNIFTWNNWYPLLNEFKTTLIEYSSQERHHQQVTDYVKWLIEFLEKQQNYDTTAEKFRSAISRIFNQNPSIEENEQLRKRLSDGAAYFRREITSWGEEFFNLPFTADTKKLARKIDHYLNEMNFVLSEILYKIDCCRNGFILEEYIIARKVYRPTKIKHIATCYSKGTVRITKNDGTVEVKAMNTIEETVYLFRKGLSIEEIAAERKFVVSTIEDHLAQAIKKNLIQIDEIMDSGELISLADYFPPDLENARLAPIRETIPFEVTYRKLKLVLAWLQKKLRA